LNISTVVAAVVFLSSVVLSQKIAVNSAARLDDEMKLRIVNVFPKRNVNYTILVFGMVIAFLLAIYIFPEYTRVFTIAYAIAFSIYIFGKLFLNVRKLREIAAPDFYIKNVIASFAVFIGGAVAAALIFLIGNAGIGR
jgi:hypothetical protein